MAGLKVGKLQRTAMNEMIGIMSRFEWDMARKTTREGRVPNEWREIWENRSPRRTRVSVRLDDDVLKFLRSLGPGYGPRLNAIARAFMQARLAGIIEGEDLLETYRERWMGKAKPRIDELLAEVREDLGEE